MIATPEESKTQIPFDKESSEKTRRLYFGKQYTPYIDDVMAEFLQLSIVMHIGGSRINFAGKTEYHIQGEENGFFISKQLASCSQRVYYTRLRKTSEGYPTRF